MSFWNEHPSISKTHTKRLVHERMPPLGVVGLYVLPFPLKVHSVWNPG